MESDLRGFALSKYVAPTGGTGGGGESEGEESESDVERDSETEDEISQYSGQQT